MESRGNNSLNKCILPHFILYSQNPTINLYINTLEYQCITLYCALERKEFLGSEKEMIQGLVKEKARLCTHEATLSHCTNTGSASTFPSSYCPSKIEQQKKNISATYCAVWPWATYFTSYKKCLFPRRLWGWTKLANESCLLHGWAEHIVSAQYLGSLSDYDTSPWLLHPLAFIWLGFSQAKMCVGLRDKRNGYAKPCSSLWMIELLALEPSSLLHSFFNIYILLVQLWIGEGKYLP